MSGAVPPPAARPLERAARVPRPVCPGCGRCGRVDPALAPQRAPLRAGVARCGGGGRASPGGGLFRRCEGRLVSGAVPPPAARPLERAARVPRPVCPGCGRCGRVDPAPAPQRAPLRAGVARCGGGGRASPGGVPSTVVRGAWCRALSLPRPPVLWSGQPGFRCACVFVCVLCLAGSGGPASRARSGAPHLFLWPLCLSALLGPLRARVAPLSLAAAPFPRCPGALVFFFFFFFSSPPAAWLVVVSRLAVGCSLVVAPPPPSPCVSRGFCRSRLVPGCCFFFFFFFFVCLFFLLVLLSLCAPVVSGFLWFPAPVALGLGACVVCFVGLPLLGSPCACSSFVLSAWLLAAPSWLLPPPPPPCFSRFPSPPLGAACRVVLCVAGCCAAPRCCALCRPVVCCPVLCCARLVPLLFAPCPLALPVALGPCALRRCVLRCSLALCALCCVCFVVARWCVLLFAALLCAVCVPGCCAVRSLCSPLCAVLCFAVLVRSRCAVRVVRAVAGAVVRCCVLCCFLWCAVVRCWVCWPVVVCWWRVSVSVSLSGRVVCFPVVGVVCCGALLSCVVFCGAVLSRGAVLLLSAVVLRCCWGLLCPSVGCRAVLCCAVGWLCCFLPGGGVCALWCSFPRALVPCCRVVPWCPVLSPCWVRFLRGCGCTYL